MAGMSVSNSVIIRDSMGRFIRECDEAATETVKETLKHGERVARAKAPRGKKPDPRTSKLARSIRGYMLSDREGVIVADARHALAQEFGAGPHPITGDLSFYWEREQTWFRGDRVNHPGNPAHPYLRPAYASMMRKIMIIAAEKYPG